MKCNPPNHAQLIAPADALDFIDARSAPCPNGLSALAIYRQATAQSPSALRMAFAIRDRVSSLFGVQPIGGFDERAEAPDPVGGDDLHFFMIEAISQRQLVLTARDVHLETMLCVDVDPSLSGSATCFITSSVITKNLFGKAYMVPVSLAHGPIVERLLSNVSVLTEG